MDARTHTHEFAVDVRPEWTPGYVCRICGWRIPGSLGAAAKNAGARFIEGAVYGPQGWVERARAEGSVR